MADARTLANAAMPARVARLPRTAAGYPIPWFVATLDDGTRDLRIAGAEQHAAAIQRKVCWVCGDQLGRYAAFVIGPMCAVNRISADPPSHRDCATYSAQVCPWLATPQMNRRPVGEVYGLIPPAGVAIMRNPGVTLVWVTRDWTAFEVPVGEAGVLYRFGDPTEHHWYAHGRPATRDEVIASFESGLPTLQEACKRDRDPTVSLKLLDQEYQTALALAPA